MKNIITLITLSLLCASTVSLAAKVYKWTDSQGNVHYGERAPNTQAKEVELRNLHPSGSEAPAPANSPQDVNKLLDTLSKERQEKADKAAAAEQERKQREKNCAAAKRNATGYQIGGRIYEIDENGERRFLGDKEIDKKLEASKREVEKWCN